MINSREAVLESATNFVNSMINQMSMYKIGYYKWMLNYMEYRKLRGQAIFDQGDDIAELACSLGKSLIDLNNLCITDSQFAAIKGYIEEIKEELGRSKKLEEK